MHKFLDCIKAVTITGALFCILANASNAKVPISDTKAKNTDEFTVSKTRMREGKEKEVSLEEADLLAGKVSQSEEKRDGKTFEVAKIIIKASPNKVFQVFTNYENTPKIFSNLKKVKIVGASGKKKSIACEAELLGGLFTFDYVLEFVEQPPNLVEWHRVSGAFKANEGYWKFEPINGGKDTLVTYSKYVDAGLLFPRFIVNKELHNNMAVIVEELKRAVEKSPS